MMTTSNRVIALFFCVIWTCWGAVIEEDQPAVSAKDLLDKKYFSHAQYGMSIEDVSSAKTMRVTTTGAEFIIDPSQHTIQCGQRLAKERIVAILTFPERTFSDLEVKYHTDGAVILEGDGAIVRINGDSLLMVCPRTGGQVSAELRFTPDYYAEYKGNYNFFDPYGGISFFEHGSCPNAELRMNKDTVSVTWNWGENNVFWAGVSPPKPYDWEHSIRERVVLRGTTDQRYMYPSDLEIMRWSRLAGFNVLYLHAENMWEGWQTEFIPRQKEEYLRVMRTAKLHEMKVMVYTSPKHFIKGTAVENRATNDVDDPRSAGWHTGSNARIFMFQIRRLKEQWDTDGFYFDEMYTNHKALAANYYVARATRDLVGQSGALYFHCTEDTLGDRRGVIGVTHCPTIHAYFSAIYKGEGVNWDTVDNDFPGYLRYNLGTYNISNTTAVACFSGGQWPSEGMDGLINKANARIVIDEYRLYTGDSVLLWKNYFPRLNTGLKEEIEPFLLKRTGLFENSQKP